MEKTVLTFLLAISSFVMAVSQPRFSGEIGVGRAFLERKITGKYADDFMLESEPRAGLFQRFSIDWQKRNRESGFSFGFFERGTHFESNPNLLFEHLARPPIWVLFEKITARHQFIFVQQQVRFRTPKRFFIGFSTAFHFYKSSRFSHPLPGSMPEKRAFFTRNSRRFEPPSDQFSTSFEFGKRLDQQLSVFVEWQMASDASFDNSWPPGMELQWQNHTIRLGARYWTDSASH